MSDLAPYKGMSEKDIDAIIDAVLEQSTLQEKITMMSGKGYAESRNTAGGYWGSEPYRAGGGCERLNVPALYFTDGPRGVARDISTCFPVSMARGATWDLDLEQRIGEIMGIEARAQGCNLSGAVCVNLLRHPGWGRAQETYGEDPFHVGELGAALSIGIQTHNVIATVKHFALNSIENARFKVDVRVDPRTLREVYLPHFKRILDAGCASVMTSYNKMNGEYCGQHRELLTDILRGEWGFEGFTHSDWFLGVYHPYGASAGLDVENPEPGQFGERLGQAVAAGHVEPAVIDTACRRILRVIYRFASAEDPYEEYHKDQVVAPDHIATALEAAEKSAVLLTNNGCLPLAKNARIGVFGTLAAMENTGDFGSSRVRPPYVTTALDGLSTYIGEDLQVLGDEHDPGAAAVAAVELDAAIIVVGTTADDEGEWIPAGLGGVQRVELGKEDKSAVGAEDAGAMGADRDRGGDRDALRLSDDHLALVRAVASANSNTIVVIVSGSAIICEWAEEVAAVLQTFYSGMEGGTALARLIFGEVSPSGKLPFTVANDESHYPFFDKNADEIEYRPLHGYSLLANKNITPQFAFGHGLSYTTFAYRALRIYRSQNGFDAQITVVNEGSYAADEVVQLYVGFPNMLVDRPVPLLRGFSRVSLVVSERKTVRITVDIDDLAFWDLRTNSWTHEPGLYTVRMGGSSDPESQLVASVEL